MENRLLDKVILVTGAASGIGKAIADRCVEEGARVVYTDLDGEAAKQAALQSKGGDRVDAIACNVRQRDQVEAAFAHVIDRFGCLDGVAANAGGGVDLASKLLDIDEDQWQAGIDLNLSGAFRTLQVGARILMEQGRGGALVATGSSTAIRPLPGQYAYMAAKAGVHQLVRALALELGEHKIRINALVPGVTDTPAVQAFGSYAQRVAEMVPLRSLIPPEEIGGLGSYMLSDETRHMTGSIVTIDAGRTVQ